MCQNRYNLHCGCLILSNYFWVQWINYLGGCQGICVKPYLIPDIYFILWIILVKAFKTILLHILYFLFSIFLTFQNLVLKINVCTKCNGKNFKDLVCSRKIRRFFVCFLSSLPYSFMLIDNYWEDSKIALIKCKNKWCSLCQIITTISQTITKWLLISLFTSSRLCHVNCFEK